jgi:hypothetical protein
MSSNTVRAIAVVMYCKRDKIQRRFHFKQILFIPCTEKVVENKTVKTIFQALLTRLTMYKIRFIYPLIRFFTTPWEYMYTQFKTASDTENCHATV